VRERNRRRKKGSPSATRSVIKLSRESSERFALGKNRSMGFQDGTGSVRLRGIFSQPSWLPGFSKFRKSNKQVPTSLSDGCRMEFLRGTGLISHFLLVFYVNYSSIEFS
jgi:hypothetical protein